jgi:cyclopropane fatty-acyl-phospholipid synthase-like methyltransferase
MMALLKKGYDVVGVDINPSSLDIAKQKLASAGYPVQLLRGDISNKVPTKSLYDVTVATFSLVFNFFPESKLSLFFQTASNLTRQSGLLIVNGFSVETTRRTHSPGEVIFRGVNRLRGNSLPTYDRVDYFGDNIRITVFHGADWESRALVTHYDLRPYTIAELETHAADHGFKLVEVKAYPQPDPFTPGESDEFFAVFMKVKE